MIDDERLETCAQCGQIFPPRYGQEHATNMAVTWYCHDCAQARADRRKNR